MKSPDDVAVLLLTETEIFPVVAPKGTVVVIEVLVAFEIIASTPLNFTELADTVELKFEPWIVTVAPITADEGEKSMIPGLGASSSFLHDQNIAQINV